MTEKTAQPVTSKMPGETQRQYTAFLLYCETGSLPKMMRAWAGICRDDVGEVSVIFKEKLGNLPAERTVERWRAKYHWVRRADIRRAEVLEELNEKSKKIDREKVHKIAEAFERITNKLLRNLRGSMEPSISEWRQVWEMFRTELGKPIGKQEITGTFLNEEEQKPPTSEEKELTKKINEVMSDHYDKINKQGKYSKHAKSSAT
jgi:hypothetical protein